MGTGKVDLDHRHDRGSTDRRVVLFRSPTSSRASAPIRLQARRSAAGTGDRQAPLLAAWPENYRNCGPHRIRTPCNVAKPAVGICGSFIVPRRADDIVRFSSISDCTLCSLSEQAKARTLSFSSLRRISAAHNILARMATQGLCLVHSNKSCSPRSSALVLTSATVKSQQQR